MVGWVSLIVAAASLALSMVLAWLRRRDQGQATFTATYARSGTGRTAMTQILIRNEGPGRAKDVTAVIALGDGDSEQVSAHPVPTVPPRQMVRIPHVMKSMCASDPGPVVVEWKDNRRKRQTLSLYVGPIPGYTQVGPSTPLEDRVREIAEDSAARVADDKIHREFGRLA